MVSVDSLVAGIDPGVRGGLVALRLGDGKIMAFFPFTKSRYKTWWQQKEAFQEIAFLVKYVFLERIPIQPADSRDGNISIAKLNAHYGFWQGVVMTCGFFDERTLFRVTPPVWQGKMKCLTGGNKRVTLNKAKKLFRDDPFAGMITHATADAALIAEYGRRKIAHRLEADLISIAISDKFGDL